MKNKQIVLARRPNGKPVPEDFALKLSDLPIPGEREALIENMYISMDAGFRNWMDEGAGDAVLPAMPIGEAVMGLTVGRVVASNHPDLVVGSILMGRLAWESYSIATDAHFLVPIAAHYDQPVSDHLGILGDTGMSAYFGLTDIGQIKEGETVLVSAAGGAVGTVAGQLAKIMGARRVVGFAGTDAKCRWLEAEVGFDATINYKRDDIESRLAEVCPDGVDVYFDNVGGELLSPVLNHINQGARIPFCGAVADYANGGVAGPSNLFEIVKNWARLEGFMTHTKLDRYDEARDALAGWLASGQLKKFEAKYYGVESCGQAFSDLFAGENYGKTIVQVAGDSGASQGKDDV